MFAEPKVKLRMRRKAWRQININYGAFSHNRYYQRKYKALYTFR